MRRGRRSGKKLYNISSIFYFNSTHRMRPGEIGLGWVVEGSGSFMLYYTPLLSNCKAAPVKQGEGGGYQVIGSYQLFLFFHKSNVWSSSHLLKNM